MLYNGIGLQTPRGSGTSGFVQRNDASVKDSEYQDNAKGKIYKSRQLQIQEDELSKTRLEPKEKDKLIKDHNKKREIDVKCMELRDSLEDQDVEEELIVQRVEELRAKLLASAREKSPTRQIESISKEAQKYNNGEDDEVNRVGIPESTLSYKSRYSERVSRK